MARARSAVSGRAFELRAAARETATDDRGHQALIEKAAVWGEPNEAPRKIFAGLGIGRHKHPIECVSRGFRDVSVQRIAAVSNLQLAAGERSYLPVGAAIKQDVHHIAVWPDTSRRTRPRSGRCVPDEVDPPALRQTPVDAAVREKRDGVDDPGASSTEDAAAGGGSAGDAPAGDLPNGPRGHELLKLGPVALKQLRADAYINQRFEIPAGVSSKVLAE
jgi:hypothetical protein